MTKVIEENSSSRNPDLKRH